MLGLILENSLLNYGDVVFFHSFGLIFPTISPTIQGIASNLSMATDY